MQVLGYIGALGLEPKLDTEIKENMPTDEAAEFLRAIPADVRASAAYKGLGPESKIMLGRILKNLTWADTVAIKLAAIAGTASGKRTKEEVAAAKGGIDLAYWLRLMSDKEYQGMGENNRKLAGLLTIAPEGVVRDAYFAMTNGTSWKYEAPDKNKTTWDFAKFPAGLSAAVKFAVKYRFPNGVPAQTAVAKETAKQADAKSNDAADKATNAAAKSNNPEVKQNAQDAKSLSDQVTQLTKQVNELTNASTKAAKEAADSSKAAAKARGEADDLRKQLKTAEAAAKDREAQIRQEEANKAQAAKENYERIANDASALAEKLAVQAQNAAQAAVDASGLAESRGLELVDIKEKLALAETKAKQTRNVALVAGGVVAAGALIWFARRNK